VLYPPNRQLSPRVRVFIGWIVRAFGAGRGGCSQSLIFRDSEGRQAAPLGAERVGVRRGRSDPTSPTPPLPPRFPPAETREGRGGAAKPGSHKHAEGLFARVRNLPSCDLLQHLMSDPLYQLIHHLLVPLDESGRRGRRRRDAGVLLDVLHHVVQDLGSA
jgi:hypothetical protein